MNYKIDMADWELWRQKGVKGQFFDPSSSGHYPDDSQKDLQFFKQDTYVVPVEHDELKKRDPVAKAKDEAEFQAFVASLDHGNINNSVLYKSTPKRAEALHKLDPRAPAPPSCPGDGNFDVTLGFGLPILSASYSIPMSSATRPLCLLLCPLQWLSAPRFLEYPHQPVTRLITSIARSKVAKPMLTLIA